MADNAGDGLKGRSRACAYCNTSKTKCIWPGEAGVGSCQRCMRLKRTCSMPDQGDRKRRGPSTRVGQLEEKIDGIMSLLNASRELQQQAAREQQQQSPHHQHQQLSSPPTNSPPRPHPPPSEYYHHQIRSEPHDLRLPPISTPVAHQPTHFDIVPGFRVTLNEANQYLDLYRAEYSPKFPFVPLPDSLTATDLFERQPFLFRVITHVVAPQSALVQREAARWIREHLAKHVIVLQEHRLELLQGLLLYIAWGDFHFYIDPRGTNLFQMAAGLVIEVGLNKPSRMPNHIPNQFVDEARRAKGFRARPPHSLQDMRAFLGVFYVNSLGASLFRHLPMFEYSGYTTTCRRAVEAAAEYPSDAFLSVLIRMQRLACRMHTMFPNPETESNDPLDFSGSSHMAIATMRNELEGLRAEIPGEIQTHYLFDICYRGILVKLYEPAIYTRPSSASPAFIQGGWRSGALWNCFEAARGFLIAYSEIPADDLPYLPCMALSYFSFAIVTATRLLFLGDSDWNQATARRSMDLASITRRLCDRFDHAEQVAAAAEGWKRKNKCVEDGRPVTGLLREKLRWIGSWYVSKVRGSDEPQPVQADGGSGMDVDAEGDVPVVDFDSEWWEALLGDYDFGQMEAADGLTR